MPLINREAPEESCTLILQKDEWQALYCRINKTNHIPNIPPTVREAIRMIAALGGFLGSKADGEPGNTVIWRGWQKLQEMIELWQIMDFTGAKRCE